MFKSNLVPEEEVALAELELFQFELFHDRDSHAVEQRKDPTSTGTLLIRHRLPFQLNLSTYQPQDHVPQALPCSRLSTVHGLALQRNLSTYEPLYSRVLHS